MAAEIHGYPISMWRKMIDRSQPEEVLLGRPRTIRSDDWAAILPMAMSQVSHEPAFPVRNSRIGLGQNMLMPFPMPVAHPLTIFRPTTWGFFLGIDTGLAWMWWSRLLGLFLALTVLARIVTNGRLGLSLLAAAVLTASPFFFFWALRPAPVTTFAAVAFASALAVAMARRPAAIVFSGAVLGWAGAAFALTLYPPFQVPVLYLLAALFAAVAWERRADLKLRQQAGWRAVALVLAGAIAAGAAALFLYSAGDALEAMRNTSYPGRRLSSSGERSFWELLGPNLFLPLRAEVWDPLRNICEAACFWLLSPPLLAGAIWQRWRQGGRFGVVDTVLAVGLGAWLIHATLGAGEWLARASGLGLVPSRRSIIALGLADTLLVVRLLSRKRPDWTEFSPPLVIALAWGALCAVAANRLGQLLPELRAETSLALAAANAGLAWLALTTRRRWIPVAVLAVASISSSAWFNPVVRGGSDYLFENPLSRKILEIDQQHGGKTRWVAYGDLRMPNLFRILGVQSLNGLHPVPQFEFWSALDPQRRFHAAYNRYAYVSFSARPVQGEKITARFHDVVAVTISPRADALRRLGVTHVLARDDYPGALRAFSDLEALYSVGKNHLYALPP